MNHRSSTPGGGIVRHRQQRQHRRFVRGVQLADDVVLVAEVVVQVARTDVHLVGDVRRRDVRLAQAVEQRQARFEDALARPARGLAFRHGAAGRKPDETGRGESSTSRRRQRADATARSSWSSVCRSSRVVCRTVCIRGVRAQRPRIGHRHPDVAVGFGEPVVPDRDAVLAQYRREHARARQRCSAASSRTPIAHRRLRCR